MGENIISHSPSIREINYHKVCRDEKCLEIIRNMKRIESFFSNFGLLSFGRNYIQCQTIFFSLQKITTACELTLGSVVACCESGCIADANTLLRKLRDDLSFYLYVVVYGECCKSDQQSDIAGKMEEKIVQWWNNDLDNLKIQEVMKAIKNSPSVSEADRKYGFQRYFKTVGKRLNNYVHSNGTAFYNRSISAYLDGTYQNQLQTLFNDMRFIAVSFAFLLTLCAPASVASTDYVDYLDANMTPPKGSQYWVAPFVEDFLKENIDLIDKSGVDYLREKTMMQFD